MSDHHHSGNSISSSSSSCSNSSRYEVIAVCILTVTTVFVISNEVLSYASTQSRALNSMESANIFRLSMDTSSSSSSSSSSKSVALCLCVISRNQRDLSRMMNDLDHAFRFTTTTTTTAGGGSRGVINASFIVVVVAVSNNNNNNNLPTSDDEDAATWYNTANNNISIPLNWSHGVLHIERRGVLDRLNVYGVAGDQIVFFIEDHMEVSTFCVLWIISQMGAVAMASSPVVVLVGGGDFKNPSGLVFSSEQLWDALVFQRQFDGGGRGEGVMDGLKTVDVLNSLMSMNQLLSVIFSTGMHGEQFIRPRYQNRLEPEAENNKLVRTWGFYEYQQLISAYAKLP